MNTTHPPRIPVLPPLVAGTTQRHLVTLPGAALNDEPRPVITVTGAAPGPVLFVGAGVHGGEYPPIETVIRLSRMLNAAELSGTVILMPVLNLPAFWSRTPFVCPVDGVNPNRVFPGAADGTYSEQMTHALMREFVAHADAYLDLHGGDIPEALVPFTICRSGTETVDVKSRELAVAFGLPYLLAVDRPVQPAKGTSSYAAAAAMGIPAVLAEAGEAGQLQPEAVQLLIDGVLRVLAHLGMMNTTAAPASEPVVLTRFEWLYSSHAGLFYPAVAAGDHVEQGQEIGSVGSLFGETLQTLTAPVAGTVLFVTISPAVREGGLLLAIGGS